VTGEINALASKAAPVDNDLLLIEDSAASSAKKKITIGSLPESALDDLSNVDSTGKAEGAILRWDGTDWVDSGPHWLHLGGTAVNTYRLIQTLPASAAYTYIVRLFHNNHIAKSHYEEILIQYSSAVWYVTFKRMTSPTVTATDEKGFIQIWRQATTNVGELWLCTEASNGSVIAEVIRVDAGNLGTKFSYLTEFEGSETTTAPSTGTKDFDSKAANPDFLIAGNTRRLYHNGLEILSFSAAQISTMTEKASPVDADLIVIEDSAASNAKKKVQLGNLPYPTVPAPQTLAAYSLDGTVTSTTYATLVNQTSGGPWIVTLIKNDDASAGHDNLWKITIDGTAILSDVTLGDGETLIGVNGTYALVLTARTSLKIEARDTIAGDADYIVKYQQVGIT
jgi:hypothetical protein